MWVGGGGLINDMIAFNFWHGALEWMLGSSVGVAHVALFGPSFWDWLGVLRVSKFDGGAEPLFKDGVTTIGKVIEHHSKMVDQVA